MDQMEGPLEAPLNEPTPQRPTPSEEEARLAVYRSLSRWALALLVATVVAVAVVPLAPRVLWRDLARGKPWRASSTFAECHREKVTCGSGKTVAFFHTNDEYQPWVEIDLGAPTRFSEVVVFNRRDGDRFVLDRAVPLILEVGDDQQTWRELAQQGKSFSVWKPRFDPTTARYVRLRSPRTTALHLDAVEIYR